MLRRSWAFLIVAALAVTACEGPEGPTGPAGSTGAAGPAGPAGAAGPAGQDANENCTQCHEDNTGLFVFQVQYGASTHRTGGNFERGAAAECAACHAHEGFVERIASGTTAPAAGFDNTSPINCRTCHLIHTTYTDADYALTTTTPISLFLPGQATLDLGEVGNLCGQCHQAGLIPSPMPEIGGADVTVTSPYWGWHHGPQAEVLGGVGFFEFPGTATITGGPMSHGNPASNTDGCGTCHMATAYGAQAGGHTWNMTYLYHGSTADNTAGCKTCHTTIDDFTGLGDVPAAVDALLVQLQAELERIGILSAGHSVPGVWKGDVAAGYINYQALNEEGSHGLHNPGYVKAILTNTIAAMKLF